MASFSNFDMYTRDGELVVDRVLQYEGLDRDFSDMMESCEITNVSLRDKTAKAGVRPKLDLSIYYGADYERPAARLVEDAFAREFAFFGYQRP